MDSHQRKLIHKILKVGRQMGATRKEKLAAIETAIVESGIANLKYGDADSKGWRQERTSIYGDKHATNVRLSARDFFSETASAGHGRGMSAGALAQSVQRSAYPERYDQVRSEAKAILNSYKGGHKHKGGHGGGKPKIVKKTIHTHGKKPLKTAELFYDPGVNIKDGQKIGPIGGHGDHVHYASANVKSLLRAAKLIQKKGGTISENPAFGGVSAGAHVTDSYHYRTKKIPKRLHHLAKKAGVHGNRIGEAFDIGGPLAKIDKTLARQTFKSSGKGGTKTVYVYASGPHKGERVSKSEAAKIGRIPYESGRNLKSSDSSAKYEAKIARMRKRQQQKAELERINAARAQAAANIGYLRERMRTPSTLPQPKPIRSSAPTTRVTISGL